MEEIWKDIKFENYDYSDIYEISNVGKVRNKKTGRILKLQKNRNGYLQIGLHKNGTRKVFYVHRLVAIHFIPNNDETKTDVNHKNELKDDNRSCNLEWCTKQYNNTYGTRAKREWETRRKNGWSLTWRQKKSQSVSGDKNPKARKVVCIETGEVFNTIKEAEEWCHGNVKNHLAGRSKSAGKHPETGKKLHWMYCDKKEGDIE